MDGDASSSTSGPWRFAQCFGDKGEVDDITEGESLLPQPGTGDFGPIIRLPSSLEAALVKWC